MNNSSNSLTLSLQDLSFEEIQQLERLLHTYHGLNVDDLLEIINVELLERECHNDIERSDFQSLHLY